MLNWLSFCERYVSSVAMAVVNISSFCEIDIYHWNLINKKTGVMVVHTPCDNLLSKFTCLSLLPHRNWVLLLRSQLGGNIFCDGRTTSAVGRVALARTVQVLHWYWCSPPIGYCICLSSIALLILLILKPPGFPSPRTSREDVMQESPDDHIASIARAGWSDVSPLLQWRVWFVRSPLLWRRIGCELSNQLSRRLSCHWRCSRVSRPMRDSAQVSGKRVPGTFHRQYCFFL